jgi:hypothetical protein
VATSYRQLNWTLQSGPILSTHLWFKPEPVSDSESYITTDDQSASLSCNKAPIWDLWSDFYYCQTVDGLSMWGTLYDEWTGLSFTIADGFSPAQSFLGTSTVRLVTIFYCSRFETSLFIASYDSQCYDGGIRTHLYTRLIKAKVKVKITLRLAVYRQSIRLGARPLKAHKQRFFPAELLRY